MKHILCKVFVCAVFLLITTGIRAQDIIVTTDAQKIEAKILEVSKTEIKYKENDNLDGPTYILETQAISTIIYSNGKVVLYNQDKSIETPSNPSQNKEEDDEELRAWIEESDRQAEQEALRRQQEREQKAREEALQNQRLREQQERAQQQLANSFEQLGESIRDLRAIKNSYALDITNNTRDPYRINLDGHILGVVNPYKTERFIVSVDIYGRMQAVQTSGYIFSPTIKEYKIPRQQKQTAYKVIIK